MKICAFRLLLMGSLLFLPGCWDRTEINDMGFVLTSAIDMENDGKIRFTVLLPLPGQMGGATGGGGGTSGDKSYYIDSDVGDTYRDAQMKLQKRMSRRMFLAHRRTILIGEDMAKRGIRDLFDALPRNPENRMTSYMIVTKGKAYDMLKATPRFERFPSEAIRELAKYRTVAQTEMKDVGIGLSAPGGSPVAVYMAVKTSEKGEKPSKEVEVKGYAQFKDDKMIGTIENVTAAGYTWLHHDRVDQTVTINIEETHPMTLRIYDVKTSIQTKLNQGRLDYTIQAKARAKLLENRSFYDLSKTDKLLKVEAGLSDYVKNAIRSMIDRSIKTQTDPAQLGGYVFRAYPNEWKSTFEKQWPSGLKDARFSIQVDSELTDIGLIYENVTKDRPNS